MCEQRGPQTAAVLLTQPVCVVAGDDFLAGDHEYFRKSVFLAVQQESTLQAEDEGISVITGTS